MARPKKKGNFLLSKLHEIADHLALLGRAEGFDLKSELRKLKRKEG